MTNSSSFLTWCIILSFSALFSYFGTTCFFRHDDWMMLGNAVIQLPQDGSILWEPRLYFSPDEKGIWFFRPLFKGILWVAFQCFHFNFLGWVLTQWALFLGSIWLGSLAVSRLSQCQLKGNLFFLLMLCSFALFAPNIVWIGEGMMNLPQLFLLSLVIYLFFLDSGFARGITIPLYLLAIGFKESGAFLPLFLATVSFLCHRFKKDRFLLTLHCLLMALYLLIRLKFMPFNPGYLPHWSFNTLVRPLAFFAFFNALPLLSVFLSGLSPLRSTFLAFIPFCLLLVGPHIGHPFFSPGWLLLPGYFLVWALAFSCPSKGIQALSFRKLIVISLVLSSIPVLWQVHQLGWTKWGISQKQVFNSLKSLDPQTVTKLLIESCPDPKRPTVTFDRVVGAENSMEHLWMLQHQSPIQVQIVSCGKLPQTQEEPFGTIVGKWNFPNFRLE